MRRVLPIIALSNLSLQAVEPVDFNRDIRPILNKNCTTCHGGVKQASEVSFIYREEALGKGESGKVVVVPGDPAASELVHRIKSNDPEEKMPPPKEHPHGLEPQQVELLERWVKEGAKWGEHWSFQKPEEPPVPSLQNTAWPKQDLDKLVLAKLEALKLSPAPEASPAEWFRRVSLDLIGLPPSPEEWTAFQQAAAANPQAAMEAAVDRLLASPQFGERWAAMWLDLARYSDTTGFEKDPHRDIWPFRDWVIRAFNADMPFDQFTIKQLAGDLLDNPEAGDLIATGFHRNTQNNTEGGTDDEEYRLAAVMDRTNTTWTAWNATTFGCIQCHSHPYDPFPHDDYYKFMAFFNNTEDVDLNNEFPRTKVADDAAKQADVVRLEKATRALRSAINDEGLTVADQLGNWQVFITTSAKSSGPEGVLTPQSDGIILASGTNPTGAVYTLTGPAKSFATLQLDILPKSDNPKDWAERGAMVSKLEVDLVKADGSRTPVKFKEVVADFMAGPFDPNEAIRDGVPGFGDFPMLRGPRRGWFVPDGPVVAGEGDQLEVRIRHGAVCNGENQSCVLNRFKISLTDEAKLNDFVRTPERATRWQEQQQKQQELGGIPGKGIPVMQERIGKATRDTRVFIRGNRMTRDHSVQPAIPAITGPPEKKDNLNRLDMAQWIVGDSNPLAARVLANRLWAELFGVGIVETQEDFGSSGLPPSNQPLLDHLALRLQKHHTWHIKPFLRELVLSASYRQASKAAPDLVARDPKNQLIARGPRLRLTAEMVRDQALLVSGLLSTKQFGPPVFPPQPDGIWKSVYNGEKWNTSQGEDRYRRGIYTYSKRTSGYPAFLTFDAPTRDVCSARRISTNTPLQALVTLNDPAYIELAQAFAKRMAGSTPAERIAAGYKLITLEDAPQPVIDTLAKLHTAAKADYEQTPAESAKLGPSADEAAMVLVANTLLNSDIALNR
ncbi:PSD1 and planctomycete cytochrome C domain-containing protein [Haloferula sp. BvORR071]|uniref:PSD1 and planctomycete cytochrome C domain-containing protein n=1 Tax=Haloferula sp. BvORR071 TaxID=1396141 RepID=UPI000696A9D0|nr:PSD1 and planctomycete cytochrome C domain-containing protein [Haloferula sp. BvORR071]